MNQENQPLEQAQNVPVKKVWYKRWWVIALGVFIIFIIILPSSDDSKTQTQTPSPAPATVPEVKVVYDIPSLFNKNIDQVKESLGTAKTDTEPTKEQLASGGTTTWEKYYEKDSEELMIQYYIKDRAVKDFFLSGEDKDHLMKIGGLKESDPTYTLEFVKQLKDPAKITGVIITPKK